VPGRDWRNAHALDHYVGSCLHGDQHEEEMAAGRIGRHAIITGGSRGIGAVVARVLGAEGARLTLLGRDRTPS
jgi:hypothetical protein